MENCYVKINQGELKGGECTTENNYKYIMFLGIPYAEPPVGVLRFKVPQLPKPWEGERDATVEATICPQINMLSGSVSGQEDCLYLNVYTPKITTPKKKLPVMVFIHSGGFAFGGGTLKNDQGPDYLIEKDVVVVTINYRLGIFGFLCLDIPEAQGNMGLKDQVQALKWVKENIGNFGGDPSNVTVFGISAGAASIDYLMVSPLGKDLFEKAITQSGAAVNHWARDYDHIKLSFDVAKHLGYHGNADIYQLHDFLISQPAEELVRSSFEIVQPIADKGVYFGFVPTIEKEFKNTDAFLTENPYKLLKNGKFHKVPIIRGFCSFEGLLMNAMKPFVVETVVTDKNMAGCLPYEVDNSGEVNDKLIAIYFDTDQPGNQGDDRDTFTLNFFSDLDFTSGVWVTGSIMAEQGVPVYMYKFAYDGGMNHAKRTFGIMRPGTAHGDDIGYIMRIEDMIEHRLDMDKKVCEHFAIMWSNFAKTGNPNPVGEDGLKQWLPFTNHQKNYLVIKEDLELRSNYQPDRMAFFEELYEKYEQ